MVFEVKQPNFDISTELTCSGDLKKSRSTSGSGGTDDSDLWIFEKISLTNYVFEVKESIADIPTELPHLDDLKNLGQLPVIEDFEVTQTR